MLKQLEDKTQVKAAHLAAGALASALIVLYFFVGMAFICDMVGFVPPTIMSFKAIESNKIDDTRHLLTYWVVFVFLSLVEIFAAVIIFWFPYYYTFKLAFLVYAFHPETRGAEKVYQMVIKPFMTKHAKAIDAAAKTITEKAKDVTSMSSDLMDAAKTIATGANTNEDHDKTN